VRLPPPPPPEERPQQLIDTENQGPDQPVVRSLPAAELEARYQAACVRLGPRGAAYLEEIRQLIADLSLLIEEDVLVLAFLEGIRLGRTRRQQGG
jgi:hypothetical protein